MEILLGWFGAVFSIFGHLGFLGFILALCLGGLGYLLGQRAPGVAVTGKMTEARRQWARRLSDASFDGLLVHRNGTIVQMNRALVRLLGYREVELLGTHFSNLAHPAQVAELRTELEAPVPQVSEFTLLHADKAEIFVEMASHTLELDGLPATVTAMRDITARKAMEARLAFLMHNDALTGLANVAMFSEKLQAAVTQNDSAGGTTSVLTLQVDTLKAVNAQLGRSGGDILLRQIANRLSAMAHDSDTVARLGGNQFAIVQPHAGAPNRTGLLTSQIETAMEEPFIVEGKAIRAGMAIGVAIYPEHATGAEGLMNASGFALSKAIEKGGIHSFSHAEAAAAGFFSVFGSAKGNGPGGQRMLSLEEQRLAQDLRLAMPRGEISLEYQPIFSGRFLSLAGFEALARWQHPKDGPIPPEQFIPLADDAGLAGALGNFILETACVEAVRCKAPMMAINLSPAQFRDPLLPGRMRDILQKTGMTPGRLEVQVTEAMLTENLAAAAQALRAIQNLGVALTLDDFGTGFSSLSNLSEFPFSRLKIDKKYVHQLGQDSAGQAIVMAVLSLARSLRIDVAAEGVESEAQLNFLQERECNFLQGYHLGRPGPQAVGPQLVGPQLAAAQASAQAAPHGLAGQPAHSPATTAGIVIAGAAAVAPAKPSVLATQR